MTSEYRNNIERYHASLLQAKKMFDLGILNDEDYERVEDLLAKKYCIKGCSVYRLNDLIVTPFRGNIIHEKEDKQ